MENVNSKTLRNTTNIVQLDKESHKIAGACISKDPFILFHLLSL